MKRILVFLTILILPLFVATPLFAQENRPQTLSLSSDETIEGNHFATNDVVTISGTVTGDVYAAGGSLTIDGTVGNDLMAAGGNILITGDIAQDVRIAGGNVTFSGASVGGSITVVGGSVTIDSATTIGRSLVAAGGNLQILSPVTSGIQMAGGNVVIGNTVGDDVMAGVGELTLTNDAVINGDLTYWSDREANIASTGAVTGEITRELPPNYQPKTEGIDEGGIAAAIAGIMFMIRFADIIFLLIVGLIILSLFPVYSNRVSTMVFARFGMSMLLGLVAIIVIPILAVLLIITFFGIPLGVFLVIMYFALLWFARIFVISAVGQYVLNRTNKKRDPRWGYVVGLAIYFVLSLLPIISMLTDLIVVLAGIGALIATKKNYYTELRGKKII